ncbi:hypothetical protein Xen7305DRAFT_00040240 [Xenococcus sp. PCC 7305]|uniref:hypothetical protein n=1 Tax=Xenococcus sp. PCC 7305 TaxID=102125 RepID=UPI0002AD177C|nr:hypothetical protein [Xenococcus sp. PCC 7305]ELS04295.1 hypothetical protein Xen7305DRAFT_00040240 [Xenococcus sp. PCC 7305]
MDSDIVIQWVFDRGAIETPVEVSNGVVSIKELGATRFVSDKDWRSLTDSENKAIIAQRCYSIPEAVTIVKFEEKIVEDFYKSSAAECILGNNLTSKTERLQALREFTQKVEHELPLVGLRSHAIRSADIQITPSGALSTAYDYENNRYIGLHIDNHERLPLKRRQEAFHVLTINLGSSERYFQFVNLGASKIAAKLHSRKKNMNVNYKDVNYKENVRQLTSNFFDAFPDYPIIKITLPPSYGYVAVTQSIIHDGATNNEGHADVAFLMSGKFSPTRLS